MGFSGTLGYKGSLG